MWIITYGTLMNKKILRNKKCKKVIVKGWKRIFNKVVSRQVWGKHAKGKKCATLNIISSKNSSFNAIAYHINKKDLKKLKEREEDYYIAKARFYSLDGKYLGFASIFASKKTKSSITPINEYKVTARKAAYSWGTEFGKLFDSTTYLCNNKKLTNSLRTTEIISKTSN